MVVERAAALLDGAVPAARRLQNAAPRDALAEAAEGAALLVLGTRRAFPTDELAAPTLAETLQEKVSCPVLEVSARGAVSLPAGQHAFARA